MHLPVDIWNTIASRVSADICARLFMTCRAFKGQLEELQICRAHFKTKDARDNFKKSLRLGWEPWILYWRKYNHSNYDDVIYLCVRFDRLDLVNVAKIRNLIYYEFQICYIAKGSIYRKDYIEKLDNLRHDVVDWYDLAKVAAKLGCIDKFEYCIRMGCLDSFQRHMQVAICNKQLHIIDYLHNKGIDISPALRYAVEMETPEVLELLLQRHGDYFCTPRSSDGTPINCIVPEVMRKRNMSHVKVLIEYGLSRGAISNAHRIIKGLIHYKESDYALELIKKYSLPLYGLTKYVIMNIGPNNDISPWSDLGSVDWNRVLIVAARVGNISVVEMALANGAQAVSVALAAAVKLPRENIVKLLRRHGGSILDLIYAKACIKYADSNMVNAIFSPIKDCECAQVSREQVRYFAIYDYKSGKRRVYAGRFTKILWVLEATVQ